MGRVGDLRTNRDLYVFVEGLGKELGDNKRSLEEYLRALWGLTKPRRQLAALPLQVFADLLRDAFLAVVPPLDPAWLPGNQPVPTERRLPGFHA